MREATEIALSIAAARGLEVVARARLLPRGMGESCSGPAADASAAALFAEFPGAEPLDAFLARVAQELRDLARAHAGAQIAAVTHGSFLRAALQQALGPLSPAGPRVEVAPGAVLVIDWPVRDAPDNPPAFVGLDLDWLPPPPPAKRPRFPGGPGSAPSRRN